MKKTLLFIFLCLLFTTCKKDKDQTDIISVTVCVTNHHPDAAPIQRAIQVMFKYKDDPSIWFNTETQAVAYNGTLCGSTDGDGKMTSTGWVKYGSVLKEGIYNWEAGDSYVPSIYGTCTLTNGQTTNIDIK